MRHVVIVGGGPAGSAMGCYLSMRGIPNTIIEQAVHPRPHVGESLVTSTTRVFREIGFLETMEREGFVRKYGAAWHPPEKTGEFAIEFREFPQEGIDQDYTYHVDCAKFDLLLLKHAEQKGSKVIQGVHVNQVLFKNGRAWGVQFEVGDKTVTMDADIVVDATGRHTLLGNQLRLKQADPIFRQFAVHAWFEDVRRGSGPTEDYIHIYFLPVSRGWIWQIPITPGITSVGVVADRNVFRESRINPEEWFHRWIRSTPEADRAMEKARRINEFKLEGDYSYCMQRFVGDGYVLIGDAARFVDPIFSSGVSVALYTAKYAAQQIAEAYEKGDFSAATLQGYEEKVRKGVGVWYEFIRLYYKMLPMFTYFLQSKQHRIEVLRLLQGEVYDRGEVRVLKEMRDFIRKVEETPDSMWKKYLSDIPID